MTDRALAAQEALVEVGARAFYEWDCPDWDIVSWDDTNEGIRDWYRNATRVVLRAQRNVTVRDKCQTCGEAKFVQRAGWRCGCGLGVYHVADCGRPAPHDPCSDCKGSGEGPPQYASTVLDIEDPTRWKQVGWTDRDHLAFTGRLDAHRDSFGVPLYVPVPRSDGADTSLVDVVERSDKEES